MDAVEEVEYKGFSIKVFPDEGPQNPRTEWDNFGHMVCFHSRYRLGDVHEFSSPEEALKFMERPDVISLPLYLYDHSGITMNTIGFSCRWDSGQVGFIYVSLAEVRKEYGVRRVGKQIRRKVESLLTAEVEAYDRYLTGSVYGYEITDKQGAHVDSCWGFFQDIKEVVKEAKAACPKEVEYKRGGAMMKKLVVIPEPRARDHDTQRLCQGICMALQREGVYAWVSQAQVVVVGKPRIRRKHSVVIHVEAPQEEMVIEKVLRASLKRTKRLTYPIASACKT